MAVTTTNLGVITAYGDAVAAGYTGTKAEWQALMASYATVGQQAVDAKNAAVAAKNTAVSKATEATTAANTATTKASEASASAQSIAQSASQIAQNTSDISELKEDLLQVLVGIDKDFVKANQPGSWTHVIENCFYEGNTITITNNGSVACIATFRNSNGNVVFQLSMDAGETKSKLITDSISYMNLYRDGNSDYNVHITLVGGIDTINNLHYNVGANSAEIGAINSKLYPYTADHYYKSLFKQKMLGISVGSKVSAVDSTIRISTVALLFAATQLAITCESGYKVSVVYCDANNVCTSATIYAQSATISANEYFHLTVRRSDDGDISLSELDNIHISQVGFSRIDYTEQRINQLQDDLNGLSDSEKHDALYYGIIWPALWATDFSSYSVAKIYGDRLYTYSSVYGRRAIMFEDVASAIAEASYDSTNKILSIAMTDESMLLLDPIANTLSLQKSTTAKVPVDKIVVLYRYYNSYGGVFYDTHYVRQFKSEVEKVIDEHVVLPKLVDQYAEQIGHVVGASDYYRSTSYVKDFTMLMISDTHEDNEEMSRAIEISEDVDAIDCVFNFGDIGGQTSAGQITSGKNYGVRFIEEANPTKPFFFTMGNHDEQHSATAEGNGTVEYGVSTIIPFLNTAEHYNARGYGYYDYVDYKVRIIMLNCFDYPDTVVNGNFVYYEDYICWQEAQVQFFISTLASVPEDYTVVVCSHYCEEGNVDNSIINQHCPSSKLFRTDATKVGTKTYMSGLVMSDIINAYKNKTTVSGTYSYSNGGMSTSYSISADFSAAEGTFAIWLCGHRHQSCVAHSVIGNYLIYVNDTSDCGNIDSVWATYVSNQPRSKGNNTRDLMTCFSIDTGNMKIKLTRIGAHVNRFLDDENLLLLSYAPTQGT